MQLASHTAKTHLFGRWFASSDDHFFIISTSEDDDSFAIGDCLYIEQHPAIIEPFQNFAILFLRLFVFMLKVLMKLIYRAGITMKFANSHDLRLFRVYFRMTVTLIGVDDFSRLIEWSHCCRLTLEVVLLHFNCLCVCVIFFFTASRLFSIVFSFGKSMRE